MTSRKRCRSWRIEGAEQRYIACTEVNHSTGTRAVGRSFSGSLGAGAGNIIFDSINRRIMTLNERLISCFVSPVA